MARVMVLDTGPLGLVTKRRGIEAADACREWVTACLRNGAAFFVPAIAYYEVRRELERINNASAIARLDAFCDAVPDRYILINRRCFTPCVYFVGAGTKCGSAYGGPQRIRL